MTLVTLFLIGNETNSVFDTRYSIYRWYLDINKVCNTLQRLSFQNKENRYVSQYCLPDFDEDCSKPPITHVINFIHKLRSDVNAISQPGPIVVHCRLVVNQISP